MSSTVRVSSGKVFMFFEDGIEKIAGWFSRLLSWSLSHKLITLAVTLAPFGWLRKPDSVWFYWK